jgi:uncharacterized protein (DUF1501 family)
MDTLTRRRFIQLTGAGAVAAAAHTLSIEEIANAAISRPLPANTPILVIVTLYGGNDGLSTVVPFREPNYYALRPELAFREDEILPIGTNYALNKSMTGLKTLWDKGEVAIVNGVGYPNSDRSHFSSMAIWQSASLVADRTGWLGRWVETQKEDPFLAIGLGSVLPPLLAGEKRSGSVLPLGGLRIPTGRLATELRKISQASSEDDRLRASAARSLNSLFSVSEETTPILMQEELPAPDLPTIVGGNAGGESNLSAQLSVVAKLIAAGSPTRVWSVSLGGFDTHADENSAQSALLGAVSNSLTKFISQIRSTSRSKDVTVMVYSEFGRRVRANASQGTDHGTSGPVFLIGSRVNRGFHGEYPSLQQLRNDDLAVTTDFRDIYASIVERVLGTDPNQVIAGWRGRSTAIG